MSRARYTKPLETLSNIDIWLEDPDITELRRTELLAARDRIAAIKAAMIMNGVIREEKDDGSGDKEVVNAKRKRSKKPKVR